MTSPGQSLYIARIELTRQAAEAAEAALDLLELDLAVWYDQDRDYARIEIYFPSRETAEARLAELKAGFREWTGSDSWKTEICAVSDVDWSEYWKRFFHLTRVSSRIIVKPSWERFESSQNEVVIELDPGMAFGTGQHFSTASCLRLIEQVTDRPSAPEPGACSFLDFGCGSGILAIAAAKLGYTPVVAMDNDPNAITVARANAARNGVEERIRFDAAELAAFSPGQAADLVTANMFSEILIEHSAIIASAVAPGGHLVVAGILTPQYARVREAYLSRGLTEVTTLNDAEWTSGCFHSCHR